MTGIDQKPSHERNLNAWKSAFAPLPRLCGTGVSGSLEQLSQTVLHNSLFGGFRAAGEPIANLPYADSVGDGAANFDLQQARFFWLALMSAEHRDCQYRGFVHTRRINLDTVS